MAAILTKNQEQILALLSQERGIVDAFYLSGGTALAEYYLRHRLSEDLDFFSEAEVDPQAISSVFKKLQPHAKIASVTYEQSFNRNLYFLHIEDDVIKTEFTHYPFPRIEKGPTIGRLEIDSLLDIAVNKVFTIYQKPRSRDFIDLFCILRQKPEWSVAELMRTAQIKFDHHLDPLQMAAQCVKATKLKDYPRMLIDLPEKERQDFFISVSKSLSQGQLTS